MGTLRDIGRSILRRGGEAGREPLLYLVSPAGWPHHGDDLITRAWLDLLTEVRPDAEVWLDCPHPGRAAHLFRHTHPRLRVTSTLWELAQMHADLPDAAAAEQAAHRIRHLGTPRIDLGLLALRGMTGVHLIGGECFDGRLPEAVGIVSALAELRRAFDVPIVATGIAVHDLPGERIGLLREGFAEFAHVEARDHVSAERLGVETGLEDALLALSVGRPVYDVEQAPANIVLAQGESRAWQDRDAIRTIESFLAGADDGEAAYLEAVPPQDTWYIADTAPGARFYPFGEMWFDGVPARAGQRWLSTRPYAHLLAAAAGAAGTVVLGPAEADQRAHRTVRELGTGWQLVVAGERAEPTVDPSFPERARALAATKRSTAERLYAGLSGS